MTTNNIIIYIYIYIYIVIIVRSCFFYIFSFLSVCLSDCLSLSISPYSLWWRAGLLNCILWLSKVPVVNFLLFDQHWHIHAEKSIKERHMNSSMALQQCPRYLVRSPLMFLRSEVSGPKAVILWVVTSKIH